MGTTTNGFPFPEPTARPDVPADIEALAEAVDRFATRPRVNARFSGTPFAVQNDSPVRVTSWAANGGHSINPDFTLTDGRYIVNRAMNLALWASVRWASLPVGMRRLDIAQQRSNGSAVDSWRDSRAVDPNSTAGTVWQSMQVPFIQVLAGDRFEVSVNQTRGFQLNVEGGLLYMAEVVR